MKLLSERFVSVVLQNSRPQSAEDEKFWTGVPKMGNGTVLIGAITAGGTPFPIDPKMGMAPWDFVRWLKTVLDAYKPEANPALPAGNGNLIAKPPEGTHVLYVTLKVLGLEKLENPFKDGIGNRPAMMRAWYVDRLWVRKDEVDAIVRGQCPESLRHRMGNHFVWGGGMKKLDLEVRDGRLAGTVESGTADGDQGFSAAIRGAVEVKSGRLTRFDVVAKGLWWAGRKTAETDHWCCYDAGLAWVPQGPKSPVAISFSLADPNENLAKVPPNAQFYDPNYLK